MKGEQDDATPSLVQNRDLCSLHRDLFHLLLAVRSCPVGYSRHPRGKRRPEDFLLRLWSVFRTKRIHHRDTEALREMPFTVPTVEDFKSWIRTLGWDSDYMKAMRSELAHRIGKLQTPH